MIYRLTKIALIPVLILGISACSTVRYIPVETIKEIHVRDSVYLRDTVIQHHLEKEYIKEYSRDTLRMETSYSEFEAYQDTLTGLLAGTARNKDKAVPIKVEVREKVTYRDSVVVKEVPVEVKVPERYIPAAYRWGLRTSLLILAMLGILLFLRFKKII